MIEKPELMNNEAFNVGGGIENSLSILELIELIEKYGYKIEYKFGDWRQADQKVYISDISKISKRFDWTPEVSPAEGVRRLVRWTEENKANFEI
jgi:CDP-paratose 2-epimerase